jgi:hypothetical protein
LNCGLLTQAMVGAHPLRSGRLGLLPMP